MITETNAKRLRIVLTGDEVRGLFGGYAGIDYADPTAKQTLHDLIRRAFPNTDFLKNTRKIYIEVRPQADGCSIELIKCQPAVKRLYATQNCLFYFRDCESLIQGALHLSDLLPQTKSTLYRLPNGYGIRVMLSRQQRLCLQNEYPLTRNRVSLSAAEEYGKIICADQALIKLKNAFFGR